MDSKATEYDGMTVDELLDANQELMARKAEAETEIREKQLRLHAALDKAVARQRLESLSTAEISILVELAKEGEQGNG